ncbi:hypothetical protein T266_32665 [Pseudomonas aeruginosa VRFPA05]|nr:hypothetical protein T266_32665 [Pseudomonas aeruginosa VRFPA05]
MRWKRCALGLLAWFGWSNRGFDSFQLRLDGGDIRVDQIVE